MPDGRAHRTSEDIALERAQQRYAEAQETLRKARRAKRARDAADARKARAEARAAWIRGTTELCDWLARSVVTVQGREVNAYDYLVSAYLPLVHEPAGDAGTGARPPVPPARPEERAS